MKISCRFIFSADIKHQQKCFLQNHLLIKYTFFSTTLSLTLSVWYAHESLIFCSSKGTTMELSTCSATSDDQKIVINHQDNHLTPSVPRSNKGQKRGQKTPGADSMKYLIESPNPGAQKALATSEIMPLLEAQHRKERKKKVKDVLANVLKVPALLGLLYVFICSLDFLSTSFRLIAGKAAGNKACHDKNINTGMDNLKNTALLWEQNLV